MDAMWTLEDKWKISTLGAVSITCIAFLLVGICTAIALMALKKKATRRQLIDQDPDARWSQPEPAGCSPIKKALMSSIRWSNASKWGEGSPGRRRLEPLLVRGAGTEMGWQSHNSTSPVWQRPILMGEKCELPRFSGLILWVTFYHIISTATNRTGSASSVTRIPCLFLLD